MKRNRLRNVDGLDDLEGLEMSCCGGGCDCFDEGYELGHDEAITEIEEAERNEMAEMMWHEVEKAIKGYLQPIEDRAMFHDDKVAQAHVTIGHEILSKLRPIFD